MIVFLNLDFPYTLHCTTPATFKSHNAVISPQFQQYSGRFNMTCLIGSHSSLALLITKTTDVSEVFRPVPRANQKRTEPQTDVPKTPPFSLADHYNFATTRKALISQFRKNGLLISAVITVPYKKAKIWPRIQ